jgi:hypothetical protein
MAKAKKPFSNPVEKGTCANGYRHINRLFSDIAQITSREVGRAWVFAGLRYHHCLGFYEPVIWLFRYVVAGNKYRHNYRHLSNGIFDTELPKPDAAAIQIKLNELIRVSKAHNSFVGVEHFTDEEIEEIRCLFEARAKAKLCGSLVTRCLCAFEEVVLQESIIGNGQNLGIDRSVEVGTVWLRRRSWGNCWTGIANWFCERLFKCPALRFAFRLHDFERPRDKANALET